MVPRDAFAVTASLYHRLREVRDNRGEVFIFFFFFFLSTAFIATRRKWAAFFDLKAKRPQRNIGASAG